MKAWIFTAKSGTIIYATGDGVVAKATIQHQVTEIIL
jgi:hypothetical protein